MLIFLLYLHSTMVLLKPPFIFTVKLIENIYIPLWFFSNPLLAQYFRSCLPFTFHYGSSQTLKTLQASFRCSYLHSTMVLLKPSKLFWPSYYHLHLHSTMVLLKRCKGYCKRKWTIIYIPLWFFSNSIDIKLDKLLMLFTFHYGSSQTC